MKIMKKIVKILILIISFMVLLSSFFLGSFFVGKAGGQKDTLWGVDFSQSHAEYLKLNWKEVYSAIINDLGVKNIKLHTNWDWVAGKKGEYYFDDIDWQIKQAEQNNVNIIYVVGLKTGRWPECHAPGWTQDMPEDQQKAEVLKYITEVVGRYKDSKAIVNWQVENEPLFKFGECPSWYYKNDKFLKEEVRLVKSLDPSRQVIVSDSGELSMWLNASKIGDIVGTTMYRRAWVNISSFGFSFSNPGFYGAYPIPPFFYSAKALIVKILSGKKVICVELQAEPWTSKPIRDASLQEQLKSMNLGMFKKNVEYAKQTGLDTFYFWGAEWWYWMKEKQNSPEIWEEAKTLFVNPVLAPSY